MFFHKYTGSIIKNYLCIIFNENSFISQFETTNFILDIDQNIFWDTISKFINKELFTITNYREKNKFKPKFTVGKGLQ